MTDTQHSTDLPVRALVHEQLSPTQKVAFDEAMSAFESGPLTLVRGGNGVGKSTILRAMHAQTGGYYLDGEDVLRAYADESGRLYEQVVYDLLKDAVETNDIIYFDNVGDFQQASLGPFYQRPGLFNSVFKALFDTVSLKGKKFVATSETAPMPPSADILILYRPTNIDIMPFKEADYRHILTARLGEQAVADIDFSKFFIFSRGMSAYLLNYVCDLLEASGNTQPSTQDIISLLEHQLLKSNVDVREVEDVSLDSLVGVEAIVERLERTVLLPLQEPDLARELGLQPKHGVLLYGPPGTGKTSIGRALAHQMKGKFFMVDGDFDHQSCSFFDKVQGLFDAAQKNAPSVIFIDDADVILTDPRLAYFGRYLLTQLDGLMNEASNRICVMMTAMNIRGLPMALLRSGRMEVWLETKLPDHQTRSGILQSYVDKLPIDATDVDYVALSDLTDGFTPADLRRVVRDAAGHLAMDRFSSGETRSLDTYLTLSGQALQSQKELAEQAFKKRGGRLYH